jgi:hypothetical protein
MQEPTIEQQLVNINQDEKSPYPYKQHPWRSLPFGTVANLEPIYFFI